MPPVRMTRAEYEAKYGTKPVVATSTLDNDPIPVRMTRAEYNATYRPKKETYGQDVSRDFTSMGQNVDAELQKGKESIAATRQRVESGETSPIKGTFQTLGGGLFAGANVLAQSALGLARTVLPQSVETRLSETIGKDLAVLTAPETRAAFVERMKQSEGGVIAPNFTKYLDRKAGAFMDEVGQVYKNDPNFRADVQAAGGILSWLSTPSATAKAVEGTLDVATDAAKLSAPVVKSAEDVFSTIKIQATRPRNDKAVERVTNEIADIENNYVKTRNKLDRDPNAVDSRARIAQSNVLDGATDNDGLIRTKQKGGPIDRYKSTPITEDGLTLLDVEDVVKRNLDTEGRTVNVNELKTNIYGAVMDSGLEGADLASALKRVEKDLAGIAIRADEFGDVLLSKIQDAKISTTKNIDYTKPVGTTYRKTLARVYKETIEEKSGLPIKEWNQELAKYYKDIDRLADLDGKRVKGGRLGKYTAGIVGSGIGAIAGTAGGGTGALIGGMVGGELASAIKGRAMAGTFRRGIDGKMPQSEVLAQANARAGIKDLSTPDTQVGVSKAILADMPESLKKEVAKVEGQIKTNIKQQKAAIAAGDFTLVEALKDVYKVLVERLKAIIDDYKKNGPPVGMSIRKTVTPESVARKSDAEDMKVLAAIIDDVTIAKTDPATKRMLSNMGLARATDDELVAFAKDVFDEKDIMANRQVLQRDLNENQNQATNAPTNAQTISDTVQNTADDVNTPPTTLLEPGSQEISINDLRVNTENISKQARENIDKIKKDILTKGQEYPIAITPEGNLVDGYHRYVAMKELGVEKIPVYVGKQAGNSGTLEGGMQSLKVPIKLPKTSTLLEEAKGKTLEEFVKAQGTPVYHATSKDFTEFDINKSNTGHGSAKAIFVSETPDATKYYQRGDKARVVEATISPDAKIFDYKTDKDVIEEFLQSVPEQPSSDAISRGFTESPRAIRRDVISSGNWGSIEGKEFQDFLKKKGYDGFRVMDMTGNEALGITNPSKIKTRTQLEDIWKQANQKPATVLEEAKKYADISKTKASDFKGGQIKLYHQTDADLKQFDRAEPTFFNTTTRNKTYGDKTIEALVDIKKPYNAGNEFWLRSEQPAKIEALRKKGYDAIIFSHDFSGGDAISQVIIIDPTKTVRGTSQL